MTTISDSSATVRQPALLDQTVVIIGGSSGIGLETARLARNEGADVVLTARDPERLRRAAADVGARRHAAFDATDSDRLNAFFQSYRCPSITSWSPPAARTTRRLPGWTSLRQSATSPSTFACFSTSPGTRSIRYDPAGHCCWCPEPEPAGLRSASASQRCSLPGCPPSRRIWHSNSLPSGSTSSLPASWTRRSRPPCWVMPSISAGTSSATLPIGRVVGPQDVAALAVHVMTNTALTGATFDVDGGQQFT